MRRLLAGQVRRVQLLVVVSGAGFFVALSALAAEQRYDLGGPCSNTVESSPFSQISAAKSAGSWDRVVELEKLCVRAGCTIEYRWRELATALLQARRKLEALQALSEMDSRGFDLNASRIGSEHQELKDFLQSPGFKTSSLGMKIEQLKKISDERRARSRALLGKLQAGERPPDNYVARGACPFECCRYRRWSVLEDTDLVAAPGSKKIVGKARKGSSALGVTGEVHLQPEAVTVLRDGDLPKDTIAFVLDYLGEGYVNVYTRGKVVETFLGVADYCFHLSEGCWGETILPANEQKQPVWWVKVKLANGIVGWTDQPDHFGDKDACG